MEDIRLKHEPFEFDGRTYMLSYNMNVLADVQSAYGGDISRALNGRATTASFLEFLTAMLNDYADEQGWPLLTRRQVGRKLAPARLNEMRDIVMALVLSSVGAEASERVDPLQAAEDSAETSSKN